MIVFILWCVVIVDFGGGIFVVDFKKLVGGYVIVYVLIVWLMFRKGKVE